LARDSDRAVFDKALDSADILIAAGSPGWLAGQGLLPAEARATRPHLVAVAITPFGLEGPHRDYRISDLVAQAAGGFLYMNGDRDRPPVRISVEQTWPQVGAQAAFVALTALYAARIHGRGEGIDLSVQEAILWTLYNVTSWWHAEQRVPVRNALRE